MQTKSINGLDLSGLDLSVLDLSGLDLSDTLVTNCNFSNADLTEFATNSLTVFENCDFSDTVGLSDLLEQSNVQSFKLDNKTYKLVE